MNKTIKAVGLLFLIVLVTAIGLSLAFQVPYLYTIIGLAIWTFVGHLVTLDDDAEGGWSNPDSSRRFWQRSLFELIVKLLVLVALLAAAARFPTLSTFGA